LAVVVGLPAAVATVLAAVVVAIAMAVAVAAVTAMEVEVVDRSVAVDVEGASRLSADREVPGGTDPQG
jgi:hypothetical protein